MVGLLASKLDDKPSPKVVEAFLRDAARKYCVFKIPKRTQGFRVIAQPSRELQRYQRTFLDNFSLPVHSAAMAYRKGQSIKENAEAHLKQKFLLRMDLENFFNSIKPALFCSVWQSFADLPSLDETDVGLINQLLFWCPSQRRGGKLVLSVGAPTSPMVSNFCLYHFDQALTEFCDTERIVYTRYADDLTFSTNMPNVLEKIPKQVQKLLKEKLTGKNYQLRVNRIKTVFSSKRYNRHVTGITLASTGKLSIGRERKRYIKHLVHQFKMGELEKVEDIAHLKGLWAFAKHIEPEFCRALERKYGLVTMQRIKEA